MLSRWARGAQVSAFALCQALCMARATRAQAISAPEPAQEPEHPTAAATVAPFPLDVAGYVAIRSLGNDDLIDRTSFREYSGSVFLSKTIGRWLFHSEINANTAPEWDSEGIHILPRLTNLSVKLETASVNYNWRDWMQVQAGFLFVPTYWRTHRYQSTTLTVDEPLIDQAVFPTAFTGMMIHGDRYREEGGISYQFYGGTSQQANFEDTVVGPDLVRSKSVGGKVVWHIPSQHLFDTLDVSFQVHQAMNSDTSRTHIYGGHVNVEHGPFHLLGEFGDASIGASPSGASPSGASPSGASPVGAGYSRQGYYLQPSYRIAPPLFVVARYERLNRDSRDPDVNRMARQSLGVTYRPILAVSLKIDVDRFEPERGRVPPYYGLGVGLVYFFRVP
jgi:hypothetical protein